MSIQQQINTLTAQLNNIPARGTINIARRRTIMRRIEELQLLLERGQR